MNQADEEGLAYRGYVGARVSPFPPFLLSFNLLTTKLICSATIRRPPMAATHGDGFLGEVRRLVASGRVPREVGDGYWSRRLRGLGWDYRRSELLGG